MWTCAWRARQPAAAKRSTWCAPPRSMCCVMDLSMPGQSGIDALAMIRAKAPDVGILILSGYPEEHYAMNLIRQGASGYLNKECEPIGDRQRDPHHRAGPPLHHAGRGRTAGAPARPQGRRARRTSSCPSASSRCSSSWPRARRRATSPRRCRCQRQDRQHLPHAPDGEDEPLLQQRPHLLRAEEQADRLKDRCLSGVMVCARTAATLSHQKAGPRVAAAAQLGLGGMV